MSSPETAASFVDQEDIDDDELLFRRIALPGWVDADNPDAEGRPRIRRAAFQYYKAEKARELGYPGPCMSVGLRTSLLDHGRQPTDFLRGWDTPEKRYGIGSLRVGDVRRVQRGVMAWPTPDEPWHAVVFSKTDESRGQRTAAESALAEAATWVHYSDVPINEED